MHVYERTRFKRFEKSAKSRKFLASAALFLVLTGCAYGQPRHAPASPLAPSDSDVVLHQPDRAPYFLNSDDDFYKQLHATLPLVHDQTSVQNIQRLMNTAVAQWLNSDIDQIRQIVKENIDGGKKTDTIPLFVAYNIPNRDLGGDARGGLDGANEYRQWIQDISRMIGDAPSVMILEPDALADIPKMPQPDQSDRVRLLRDALTTFSQNNRQTAVYLDTGNSKWLRPSEVADLIRRVDGGHRIVGGISLNVSSYRSEQETRAYADSIFHDLGHSLHVMIDNSRNGAPNTDRLKGWCNVVGIRIGAVDGEYSPDQQFEQAYIKTPGESDGVCGDSDKPAGEFDTNLLIDQVS